LIGIMECWNEHGRTVINHLWLPLDLPKSELLTTPD
jgi:hypothetical protein